jgi:hypothetical protein
VRPVKSEAMEAVVWWKALVMPGTATPLAASASSAGVPIFPP